MLKASDLLSHAASVLPVQNMEKGISFYRHQLGFKLTFSWKEPKEYAVLKRGGVSIHLTRMDVQVEKVPTSTVYIFVHDIEEYSRELNSRGMQPPGSPESQEYGMMELEIEDPQGHRLIFGKGVE